MSEPNDGAKLFVSFYIGLPDLTTIDDNTLFDWGVDYKLITDGVVGMYEDIVNGNSNRYERFMQMLPIWESGERGQMNDYRPQSIPSVIRCRIPILLDARWAHGSPEPWSSPPQEEDGPEPPGDFGSFYMWPFVMNRHSGGINSLFMDWSVRKVGIKELWTFKWHPVFNTAGRWTLAGGVKSEDWPEWMRSFKDY